MRDLPAKMGPNATARAGAVAEESWVLAARTTCGPGVTLLPVRLRPASEHPPAVCVCAVGAHCSSPADGDVPCAGTQHMQRLGGWACRHGAELRVTSSYPVRGMGPMLCRKSDHHLNALRRRNRTKRPTAQTRHPGQWLVPRASRGHTLGRSSNGRKCYLKFSAGVVPRPQSTIVKPSP